MTPHVDDVKKHNPPPSLPPTFVSPPASPVTPVAPIAPVSPP